ncbi:MAG TPA: hypothetical protein VMF05_15290 [Stellaceae bacterium]|nr:hypothetical protein [Stellaceae bacterium]
MIRRLCVTAVLLLLALGAFCGIAGPAQGGLLNPFGLLFGLLFLVLAAINWSLWNSFAGSVSRPQLGEAFKAFVGPSHAGGRDRAGDDHYRRDGEQNYRETDETRR